MKTIIMSGLLATIAATGLAAAPHRADAHADPALGQRPVALDVGTTGTRTFVSASMVPGDSLTEAMAIENRGTAELRYAVTSSSTDPDGKDLRGILTVEIRTEDLGAGAAFADDGDRCDDATGAQIRAAASMGATSELVGSPNQGSQRGDRVLAPGSREALCITVALPLSAGNAHQGASTRTTFTFAAEQTANNP